MGKKIVAITDMAFVGSGYFYIFTNLVNGLVKQGHSVTVAGLGYIGEPHSFPFSIIPAQTLQDAVSIMNNLIFLQDPDLLLVALDIPLQIQIHNTLKDAKKKDGQTKVKYMAITPLENGPLLDDWAVPLSTMDSVFFISQLGADEAKKAGVTQAEHLYVGVDTNLWHPASASERTNLRNGLGFAEDEFVILTVADNQERKNLAAGMQIVAGLKEKRPDLKIKYVIVTREDNPFGWRLRSLAKYYGLMNEYLPFNKGIPSQDLWGLYGVADVYLQPSKAEGLGMPVLEAMACGIPCIATDTGALHELLTDNRGHLVPSAYQIIDVWGNSRRDFINTERGTMALLDLLRWKDEGSPLPAERTDAALQYVRSRTWEYPVKQVNDKIAELFHEQTQTKE